MWKNGSPPLLVFGSLNVSGRETLDAASPGAVSETRTLGIAFDALFDIRERRRTPLLRHERSDSLGSIIPNFLPTVPAVLPTVPKY